MPEEAPLGRKLLGTLTVNASRGDVWAYQSKTTVTTDSKTTPGGTTKTSLGVARGEALAVNEAKCLLEDCDTPIARVTTSVTPGSATTGPKATVDAYAKGSKLSATRVRWEWGWEGEGWVPGVGRRCGRARCLFQNPPHLSARPPPLQTNAASVDMARNGNDIAVATTFADAYSVQGNGQASRTFATAQANAAAGVDLAQWSGSGVAVAEPLGDYGHKNARVQTQGFAAVDGLDGFYGRHN